MFILFQLIQKNVTDKLLWLQIKFPFYACFGNLILIQFSSTEMTHLGLRETQAE